MNHLNGSTKNIVITGSSRGIGYGLAREFLLAGHRVMLSGREEEALKDARARLESETGSQALDSAVCNVVSTEDLAKLWDRAASYGEVDLWINNAGIGQGTKPTVEIEPETIALILETNITGTVMGSRIALERMLVQGSGAIYNMEGFGSDGRKMKSMSIYGTSKCAVRYFTQSLALETAGTPVIAGSLSPGMVVTRLLTHPVSEDTPLNRQAIRIFNILSDRVETVTPFLVKEILKNDKNGRRIRWLTPGKLMARFIANLIVKRKVEGLPELPER